MTDDDKTADDRREARITEYLRRAAMNYLERYATSERNLERVLARKLARRVREDAERWGLEEATAERLVGEAVASLRTLGLLDDAAYADLKAASGRRKGHSGRRIAATMAAKGIDRDTAAAAVGDDAHAELRAAVVFARRRRVGPFAAEPSTTPEQRRREAGVLARQGFGGDVTRRVLAMDRNVAEAILSGADPDAV
jgi:regulatory protein